jgi:alkanesulfonate monooxygenase SsuD/methylene tetrahydromethanopterin reductase-like flavin-dependent oxidoreductase (luciferase family)
MDVGIVVPQGWTGEYHGRDAASAWQRSVEVARYADAAGYESIWLFDHFHPEEPGDELTFEAFSSLAALAALTRHVRLGHIVTCAGYRNPALAAKTISTIDVISGGRVEFGIGAGWHQEEYEAYGYGFPSLRDRQALLSDSLEIARHMLAPGRATYAGVQASVTDALNLPRGLQQPRIPIIVGGNGPEVTWRLAARYADELNLDGFTPERLAEAMPLIRSRCEEIGRDPNDLRVSVFMWWGNAPAAGAERIRWLQAFCELGVSRVMVSLMEAATSDEPLELLGDDVRAAGFSLDQR